MDFAEYCTGWYHYSDRRNEYLWHNAPEGFDPIDGKKISITLDELYKRFLKTII